MQSLLPVLMRCAIVCGLLYGGAIRAADGVVGPDNCSEAGFVDVLAAVTASGGGVISFNCGVAPVTIAVTTYRPITVPIVIDGADRISFDGANTSAFFQIFAGASLRLSRLTLRRGVFNSVHALENFGSLTLDRCTVTQNISSASAIANFGALAIRNSNLSFNAINTNIVPLGAALLNDSNAEALIDTSVFSDNSIGAGIGNGGAIAHVAGHLRIVNSTFLRNSAADGGAIHVAPTGFATIAGSTFSANLAGYGAALETSGGLVKVTDSIFVDNAASSGDGGAIWMLAGILKVNRSEFRDNDSATTGGAISCYGDALTVADSSFVDNQSSGAGGAIYSSCSLSVNNATFTGNSTIGANGGGAINQSGTSSGLVSYATIHANTAAFGAGLYKDAAAVGTLFITRSIVSANSGGNCDGDVGSNGYNLVNDNGCVNFVQPGDAKNATIPLLPLGNYGGTTPTLPPAPSNAGIDRIPLPICANSSDQRGAIRPAAAGCDSGAFESGASFDRLFADGFDD